MAAWNLIERLKSVNIGIVNETLASGVRVDTTGINAVHKKPVRHLLTLSSWSPRLLTCLSYHLITC